MRAIHAIADRNGVARAELLHGGYGIDEAGKLSITEASQLIDELKGAGKGGRRPAMITAATVSPNRVGRELTGGRRAEIGAVCVKSVTTPSALDAERTRC